MCYYSSIKNNNMENLKRTDEPYHWADDLFVSRG